MSEPCISIVIPARNSEKTLAKCLSHIESQTFIHHVKEVVVVDDDSTDSTKEIISQSFAKYLFSGKRQRASTRNIGWRQCSGRYILFLDSDCFLESEWIEKVMGLMENPLVGGGNSLAVNSPQEKSKSTGVGIPGLSTSACMYKRSVLESLGGFDEEMDEFEDTDLAWRALYSGYALAKTENVAVIHSQTHLSFQRRLKRIYSKGTWLPFLVWSWSKKGGASPYRLLQKASAFDFKALGKLPRKSDELMPWTRNLVSHLVLSIGFVVGNARIFRSRKPTHPKVEATGGEPFCVSGEKQFYLDEPYRFVSDGEKTHIIKLNELSYVGSSGVMPEVLESLARKKTLQMAAVRIAEKYEVGVDQVSSDIADLLVQLVGRGVVKEKCGGTHV